MGKLIFIGTVSPALGYKDIPVIWSLVMMHRNFSVFIVIRLGIWHVRVGEFVDIFCAHPSQRRPNGKQNQQIFTNPNMSNPKYAYNGETTLQLGITVCKPFDSM